MVSAQKEPPPPVGGGGGGKEFGLRETDVGGLKAFRSFRHFELHRLAFLERLVALRLNGGEVDEDVLSALRRDEPVALGGVKPFHCSLH